jgi:DNA processing protein
MEEVIFLNKLLHAKGLGRSRILQLIHQYGSAKEVFHLGWNSKKNLLFDKWTLSPDWELDFDEAQKEGVQLVHFQHPHYPQCLLDLPDFPLLLYIQGSLTDCPRLGLVGTRNATLYGKQMAHHLAKELAETGVCILSGLARGIDTAAHVGALEGRGKTVAVIGSGLGHIYPPENRMLAAKMAHSGAIISEYPMKTPPAKGFFPKRNRIISGLSQGVCLIESPLKGGGMLTMELALQQNRPLFAIPGRLDWPTFEGNHYWIQSQKAKLATKGEDLLKHLNITKNQKVNELQLPLLTAQENQFLQKLPAEEKTIEELVLLTQLPMMQLNVFLTRLILKKAIKEFPGKIYKKT